MRALVMGAVAWLGAAAPAAAQGTGTVVLSEADVDKLVELVRKHVRAEKADIVAKNMKLDAAQASAFWPVYKAYEAERQALGTDRLRVIEDLAEHFDSLDDAKAKALLDRSFALEAQRVALEERYKDQLVKVLPAKTVARFFQVESRINNLINLEISSEIPLLY
jgi:hypothetical protein